MMRTRVTRSGPDRPFNPRQNYNRHEDPDPRPPRYNSPGRYRDYDYNSNREPKDNFNSSRDFSYRDYNQGRDFTPRDYQTRDYNRDYQNSKDFNNPRDYTNPREYINNSRDYPNNSRDYQVVTRDYHQNSREFNGPRDFQSSREFGSREYSNNRYYPHNNREFRYREYPQSSRVYQQSNKMLDYEKPYQERRYYERQGPYERRNLPRHDIRRVDGQGYDFEPKRASGPVRRTGGQGQKVHRTKVFIGNLSGEVTQEQLTTKFSTFGPINRIDFRRKFAFVDYVRSKDADTAIREMHNKLVWGSWLKVQPHIEQQKKITSREPKPSFQITVTNLDQSVSWQDLKDFARQAGDVNYASIIIKGDKRFGLIEYTNEESVKKAMKDLNGKKIVSNKLELIHVPVSEFLKKLGFNNEGILVETAEEGDSNVSITQNEFNFEENDRYNNDTFEAEDNSKSPSPNNLSSKDDLYQEGNLDSVDYN